MDRKDLKERKSEQERGDIREVERREQERERNREGE